MMLETRATSGLKFNLWRGEDSGGHVISVSKATIPRGLIVDKTDPSLRLAHIQATPLTCPRLQTRKPRHRTPRGSSSSRRHHLNTPDSGAATSTPPPPPRRHLDTLNCPDARAAAPCRRCLNRHPALTATTAATDHHPRQQRHRRINPTRRTPINAAPTPRATSPPPQSPPPPLPSTHPSKQRHHNDDHPRQQRHRRVNPTHRTAINAAAAAPTPHATSPQQHHRPRPRTPPTPSRSTALARPRPYSISSFM
ncbi:hypothetical protein EDB85DRAFT_2280432 [Lactarius pseudohatsudake]|nr:hypothetical protein EDB85DRAFT_2280432 [Lactarius pseudohatsudake]